MQNRKFLLLAFLTIFTGSLFAQNREFVLQYIENYRELAIEEMKRTGVPAAIKLAQGIHETNAGQSVLVLKSNNHFGIKCKSYWTGPSVKHDDDARNECFRAYPDPKDSYRDHSDFLKNGSRYASLFRLDPEDYKGWAWGLKKAGYATNPKYPQVLIRIIEEYGLQDYTLIALGKMQPKEEWLVKEQHQQTGATPVVAMASGPQRSNADETAAVPAMDYPNGLFRINDTKVVFVKAGTPYLMIAQQYDVDLARLFEFNELEEGETADRDQLIYLQRKRTTGAGEYHTVKAGETLHHISQVQGIRLKSLLELNQLQPHMQVASGEKLYLKQQSPAQPRLYKATGIAAVVTDPAEEIVWHTVQTKETLYSISRMYGVTVSDIRSWNTLESDALQTGQKLKIQKTNSDGSY